MMKRVALAWMAAMVIGVAGAWAEEAGRWDGTWVVKRAMIGRSGIARWAWDVTIKIEKGQFEVRHFEGGKQTLKGELSVGKEKGGEVDLQTNGVDLSEQWMGAKFGAAEIPGLYRFETEDGEEVLKVCFRVGDGERPQALSRTEQDIVRMTLVRAGTEVVEHGIPEKVKVRVTDEAGKPVPGAIVFTKMQLLHSQRLDNHWTYHENAQWTFDDMGRTGKDGTTEVPSRLFKGHSLVARDQEGKRLGMALATAGVLQRGELTVVLRPACHVIGTVESEDLRSDMRSLGWIYASLLWEGQAVGEFDSYNADFVFNLPAGHYEMFVSGTDVLDRYVTLEVPAGKEEYAAPPFHLRANPLSLLMETTAPEFKPVLGWKGTAVTLASLRGKVVLVNFWRYDNVPSVTEMPMFMALAEKYKEKGLAVVGVHVDEGFDHIDTAAKLDERLAEIRQKLWKGKDLPFAVALTSGKRNDDGVPQGVAGQYGIKQFPTAIVVDREGTLRGVLEPRNEKQVEEEVEKWLAR